MVTRKQKLFWVILIALANFLLFSILVCLLLIHVRYCSFYIPKPAAMPPSVIGLGFLALVLAISVYLRQVASLADEQQNKILRNEIPLYPMGQRYTKAKLARLNETHENLTVVAPFFIWLCLLTSVRIFAAEFASFRIVHGPTWLLLGKLYNLALTAWLTFLFGLLSFFHFRASRRDEQLRGEALHAMIQKNTEGEPPIG